MVLPRRRWQRDSPVPAEHQPLTCLAQVRADRLFGHAQGGGDLGLLHPPLPAQRRDGVLPLGHVLDDLPAPLQHDRRKSQRWNVHRGLAVPGLDPWQPVPPGRLAPETADRDVGDRRPQPGPPLPLGQAPQDPPLPGRCLKRRLPGHQPAPGPHGQHAGIPEQPNSMGGETAASSPASRRQIRSSPTQASGSTGRARHLADPHTLRQNQRIAQMRSSTGQAPGPARRTMAPLHDAQPAGARSRPQPPPPPAPPPGRGRAGRQHARRCQTAPPQDHQDSRMKSPAALNP